MGLLKMLCTSILSRAMAWCLNGKRCIASIEKTLSVWSWIQFWANTDKRPFYLGKESSQRDLIYECTNIWSKMSVCYDWFFVFISGHYVAISSLAAVKLPVFGGHWCYTRPGWSELLQQLLPRPSRPRWYSRLGLLIIIFQCVWHFVF